MRIDILTLFPETVGDVLSDSILGRAQERGFITIRTHQIRDYTTNKQNQVDDQENEKYVIYDGDTTLKTPAGNTVTTLYKPLAERIVLDLTKFGYSFHSSSSILAWHFTMIDNFARMSHEQVEQLLQSSFLTQPDWTCIEAHGSAWQRAFGDIGTRYRNSTTNKFGVFRFIFYKSCAQKNKPLKRFPSLTKEGIANTFQSRSLSLWLDRTHGLKAARLQ